MTIDELYKKYNHMYDNPMYQGKITVAQAMLAYDMVRNGVEPDDTIGDDMDMLLEFFAIRDAF